MQVLIVTGDRDALQLVDGRVTVLMPRRGISEMTRFDPPTVEQTYGMTPLQYPDYAALRGDPSDNLPSVPGVGEKTAAKWIVQYGSLQALLDHADELPGKQGVSLREHLEDVRTNRHLTQLVRTVDLPVTPADLQRRPYDEAEVASLFDTLQFRVLRERLGRSLGDTPSAPQSAGFEVQAQLLEPGALAAFVASLPVGPVALAFSGHWGRGAGDITSMALATAQGPSAVITLAELTADDDAALATFLADAQRPKIVHDVKGPLLALAERGLTLAGVSFDTALAAYLVNPGQRSFDLADVVARHLQRQLRADVAGGEQLSLDGGDEKSDAQALAVAAQAIIDLAAVLAADLAATESTSLLDDVELPLTFLLARMERTGIAVDSGLLGELTASFAQDGAEVTRQAYASVGHEFNLGSPKQLQTVLFDELGLPKTKKIKTGYTTDADALAFLASRSDHPLIGLLLRHRDVTRLRTVVDGLLAAVDDSDRIHTTFNQTVAATGRLSSTEPNLQNIPVRTAEGRRIRSAFVAGSGFTELITADYAQIEMRIMAHLSDDENLISAFLSGEDLHTWVAAQVYDLPPGRVDGEMRRRIKAMGYGLAYGLSAYGLAGQLGVSTDEARTLMDAYFTRFGKVADYLSGVVDQARVDGYTSTILGRRRYLPDLSSDVAQRRQIAERMALNAPIQGSAADIIKLAMLRVDAELTAGHYQSRLLLQVHDELVVEVAAGESDAVESVLREQMGSAYPLRVPLEVSVGRGNNWDAAGH
jgi:DNA polymerase-1